MAKEFISTVRLFLCSFAVLGMLSSLRLFTMVTVIKMQTSIP